MPTEEPEQLERIPWAELLSQARPTRSWPTYAAIGALFVAAVAFAMTRREVIPPTVTMASAPSVVSPPATVALPVPEVPSEILYAEADLMAAVPDLDLEAVTGRAEWFVYEYFTGSGDDWSTVATLLPDGVFGGAILPERGATYVEWARAVGVSETRTGLYDVLVAFRLLAPDGDRYRRLPVTGVEIRVEIDDDGVATVADLPEAAALPQGRLDRSWGVEAEPPPEVAAEALATAEDWGDEPELLSASLIEGKWRTVVVVRDEAGNPWVLRVSDVQG